MRNFLSNYNIDRKIFQKKYTYLDIHDLYVHTFSGIGYTYSADTETISIMASSNTELPDSIESTLYLDFTKAFPWTFCSGLMI